jgi:hypothetical protein
MRRSHGPAELGRIFPRAVGKAAHRELKANGRRLVDRCLAEHVRVPAAAVVARPVEPRVVSAIAPVFIRGVRFGCFGGRGIIAARPLTKGGA